MRLIAWTLPATLALVACGGGSAATNPETPTNDTATTTADDEALAADMHEHHGHHHGGMMHLVLMSAESLGGTPEQQEKIEAIRKDLAAKVAPVHEANKNLLVTLADVLADGAATADEQAKVDAAVAQLGAAASTAHTAGTDALNKLHGVLDAAQRGVLVEKVEAHWELWRNANASDDAEDRRLTHLTKALGLAPDQVEKMKAALKAGMASAPHRLDPALVEAHMKSFGAAFVQEQFDAASLKGENVSSHLASSGAARMARFYVLIAPLLTPEQRTKLADHFRKHQNKGPELPT